MMGRIGQDFVVTRTKGIGTVAQCTWTSGKRIFIIFHNKAELVDHYKIDIRQGLNMQRIYQVECKTYFLRRTESFFTVPNRRSIG